MSSSVAYVLVHYFLCDVVFMYLVADKRAKNVLSMWYFVLWIIFLYERGLFVVVNCLIIC